MRSSGVPASISKNIRGTQLLARRPFKVAAVATTDHVIGALGRRSLFDHMALGLTARELLQSLFILVLNLRAPWSRSQARRAPARPSAPLMPCAAKPASNPGRADTLYFVRPGLGGAALDSLAANRDARAHRYSNGNDALSPLKASRRSVFWQRTHSNLRCSYPAALMAKSCSTCTMRISAPHEMQRIFKPLLLDEQGRGREHDPRNERGETGEQHEVFQDSGDHCSLPYAAPLKHCGHSALQYLGQKVMGDCLN